MFKATEWYDEREVGKAVKELVEEVYQTVSIKLTIKLHHLTLHLWTQRVQLNEKTSSFCPNFIPNIMVTRAR